VNNTWRFIAKSLGAKTGNNDREANIVATIRLAMFLSILATNIVIVAGVIRHWSHP
jgi:hypothetical protein